MIEITEHNGLIDPKLLEDELDIILSDTQLAIELLIQKQNGEAGPLQPFEVDT